MTKPKTGDIFSVPAYDYQTKSQISTFWLKLSSLSSPLLPELSSLLKLLGELASDKLSLSLRFSPKLYKKNNKFSQYWLSIKTIETKHFFEIICCSNMQNFYNIIRSYHYKAEDLSLKGRHHIQFTANDLPVNGHS